MQQEAIILAGGLGTRLRSVVADLPKCMAPVAGRPFLWYVIDYLQTQQVQHFIFSVGYLSEPIVDFVATAFPGLRYTISKEDEPLGTGGAIRQALTFAEGENILVTNGDTLFKASVAELMQLHEAQKSACTLALKPMQQFDRYGVVDINANGQITSFKEKQWYDDGLINGGLYLLRKSQFPFAQLPEKCSFEKDYLERYFTDGQMHGLSQDAYFIDIGIPEDFARAQLELSR